MMIVLVEKHSTLSPSVTFTLSCLEDGYLELIPTKTYIMLDYCVTIHLLHNLPILLSKLLVSKDLALCIVSLRRFCS